MSYISEDENELGFSGEGLGASSFLLSQEILLVGSVRNSIQMICCSPTSEVDPVRDALILEAVLSTTLGEKTCMELALRFYTRWLLPTLNTDPKKVLEEEEIENKTKIKRRKKKSAPESEEHED